VTKAIYILLLGAICTVVACERSLDDPVQEMATETGLAIIDLTVPFERFAEAPERLQRIADALVSGSSGLYVLRYHDDTLRHTQHIFVIHQKSNSYIELSSLPNEPRTRSESTINSAEYDEQTKTLILHTPAGDIRLTAMDITPTGA